MVDLHIHSAWSDGVRSPKEILVEWSAFSIISITDHNSLRGFLELQPDPGQSPVVLPGFETRLMGEPDYLFYLPTNSLDRIKKAESELVELRRGDHLISRHVYIDKFKLLDFEETLKKICRRYNLADQLCTTRELVDIIELKGGVRPDISHVRKLKGKAIKMALEGNLPDLEEAACNAAPHYYKPKEWLFGFAQRHEAVVAFAHPWHEVVRQTRKVCDEPLIINKANAVSLLEDLVCRFASIFPEGALELLPNSSVNGISRHFCVDTNVLSDILLRVARKFSLSVVVGSDAHTKEHRPHSTLSREDNWEYQYKLLPSKICSFFEKN